MAVWRFAFASALIRLGHPSLTKRTVQVSKLAILYATPPLSPTAHRSALEAPLAAFKGRTLGMDSNDPRRRQSNPSGYASQQGLLQQSPQYPATSASDRYRASQLGIQSPTSAPSTGRSGNIPGYSYGYGESSSFGGSSMNPSSMSYQSQYGEDTSRQSQPYGQYGSNMMYNAPAQQQVPTQPAYEPVQQYQQPRQSTAIEVLTNQFDVPQQYYGAGGSGPTSAPISAMGPQNPSTQYPPMSYTQQTSAPRETLPSAYTMGDATQSAQSGYGQSSSYSAGELDNAYGQYQNELKRTFESIRDGRLADAAGSLVNISDWLLGNAESLGRLGAMTSLLCEPGLRLTIGLVRDDEQMHADRIKLWEQFNTAWLSALQTQRDMTMSMLDSGQRPQAPKSLMDTEQMETMGKELVRLCDLMEKHGLVDYQMGVWEEDIISCKCGLTDCGESC